MVVKSKFADVEIPDVTVHHLIFQKLKEFGHRTVWVNGETGQSFTLRETYDISQKISAVLEKRGLKKGDVLAIFCHNCPEFAFMVYGCMALGVIVTTVSTAFTHVELSRQLKDSGATYIFTDQELVPKAKHSARDTGQIREIFTIGTAPGCTPFTEFTTYSGPQFDGSRIRFTPKEDVVLIPYSSGTTGLPKGVVITHRNIVACFAMTYYSPINAKTTNNVDHMLAVLPLYHIYGLFLHVCCNAALGDQVVTMKRFIPQKWLENIGKYKITELFIVPPLVVFLNKSPLVRNFDISSVKIVASGAAPLKEETELEFMKQYPNVKEFRQGYGMTELCPLAIASPRGKPKRGSIGVVAPNTEVKVVDPVTNEELGPNKNGELWVRGPQIMKGYLNRPEETRKTIDEQGWLHTGDIGCYDEEEYFYILDRVKELIKVKGLQVAPAELEALLLDHPRIADAAVTSVPDEAAGELPLAFVVKKPDVNLSEEQVKQYVAERAASYKQLKGGVKFVDQIPKSESGKILRRQLKDQLLKSKL